MLDPDIKFSTEYSYRIKVLVLGAKQSGKSSLIYTYKHDMPPLHKISSQETDAIIKKIKYIKSNKEKSQKQHFQCNIHLWDTTAEQSPDVLKNILLKRVNAIILVFDRHNRSSFEKMKAIWAKIQDQRKKLYHVEVVLIGNLREKNVLSSQKQNDAFLTNSLRDNQFGSARRKINNLVEDDFIRAERNDVIIEDFNSMMNSRMQKNSIRKNNFIESSEYNEDFLYQIKAFQDSQGCEYCEISVHKPQQVREVFQKIIGKVMRNIEQGKVSLQQVIIKDTQGKIKLRKFDFKTYEYFEKRYNKCC